MKIFNWNQIPKQKSSKDASILTSNVANEKYTLTRMELNSFRSGKIRGNSGDLVNLSRNNRLEVIINLSADKLVMVSNT